MPEPIMHLGGEKALPAMLEAYEDAADGTTIEVAIGHALNFAETMVCVEIGERKYAFTPPQAFLASLVCLTHGWQHFAQCLALSAQEAHKATHGATRH